MSDIDVNQLSDNQKDEPSNDYNFDINENDEIPQGQHQNSEKKKSLISKKYKNNSQTVIINEKQQFIEENNKESQEEKFSVAETQQKQQEEQRETKNLSKQYGSILYKAIQKQDISQQGIYIQNICNNQILKLQVQISARFKVVYRGKRSLRIFINLYFVFQNPQRYYQLIETEKQLCCSKIFEKTLSWMFRFQEFILMEMSIIKKIRKINKINMIQLAFVEKYEKIMLLIQKSTIQSLPVVFKSKSR